MREAGPADPAARALLAEFARESEERYGRVFKASALRTRPWSQTGSSRPVTACSVIDCVACGGLRRLDDDTAEVKRMYVGPAHRRQGHRRLLSTLEAAAQDLGYTR